MKDEAHHQEETRCEAIERVEQEARDHAAVPAKVTPPVTVIDAIMGAGKTHHAIGTMNRLYADAIYGDGVNPRIDPPKWIYITPLLDEVTRVKDACPLLDFQEPSKETFGTKSRHFDHLIIQGRNVVTTHSLFPLLSAEGLKALAEHGYRLIIDEAVEAVAVYSNLSPRQLQFLQEAGMMSVAEDGLCRWEHDDKGGKLETRFEDVKTLCKTGSLYLFEDHSLIWKLPREIMDVFKEITILTYMFEASTLCSFLKHEGVAYRVLGIQPSTAQIVPIEDVNEKLIKDKIREKLKLYEGPRNRIGDHRKKGSRQGSQKFTKTYFDRSMKEEDRRAVIDAVATYIRHYAKVPGALVGWTTFKDFKGKLAGPRYSDENCFISINARATNDYADRQCMIYLANRFPKPELLKYLAKHDVHMEVDLWALAELLQWLWRGCIRRCDRDDHSPNMHVFIPAERMRRLFTAWLESDTREDLRSAIGPWQNDK